MPGNIFANLPQKFPEEFFETLAEKSCVRIERIVSRGHVTPKNQWYDQDWDEWVLLLEGSAGLLFADETVPVTLKPGDHLMIPAGRRHRVEWTAPDRNTVWLAVHIGAVKS